MVYNISSLFKLISYLDYNLDAFVVMVAYLRVVGGLVRFQKAHFAEVG